jgi:histidinol phosphatase-like PHP family hydrolase
MLTNREIGELLARRAEEIDDEHRSRAYRRAARASLIWPAEATEVLESGGSLRDLHAVGSRLAGRINDWVERPPEVPDPPEKRAGFLTLAEVRAILAQDPSWQSEVRGDLQMHSLGSDGKNTIEEMARRGAELRYEYIALTDHTKGIRIARGMDEPAFVRQALEVQAANDALERDRLEVRVLHGAEMNIDVAGAGDMDPAAMLDLDLVLGSFHSALRKTDDQTPRYLAALRNPSVHVLGHPRGRRFDQRPGLNADWPRVFDAASDLGKAVEIDCHPHRQDLSVELLREAATTEVYFSIGTDAHDVDEMGFMEFGLAAAALAGIPKERVLNYWSRSRIQSWAGDR